MKFIILIFTNFAWFLLLPFRFSILEEEEFQGKVLGGMNALTEQFSDMKSQQDILVANYDQLDQDTKKAFEDLTRAKNALNDQSDLIKKFDRVHLQLKRELRLPRFSKSSRA